MKLTVNQGEAARLLSISVNHFKAHVRPDLPAVYIGGKRVWRVRDLESWLDRQTP